MIIVYIKKQQFFKNVDEYGNIFEIEYPTREVFVSQNEEKIERITETYDNYIENGFVKIELDEKYKDCNYFDFNDDLTFSVEKYNARKQAIANEEYENKIVSLIRKKYNINQELAILRQRDTKPLEFKEYNAYVEQCKEQVKNVHNYEEVLANAVNQESEQEGA